MLVCGVAPEAGAVEHTLCLDFPLGDDFWDASPRAADGNDFYEQEGRDEGTRPYPAKRLLVRVHDEGDDIPVFGWSPLDGTGCATFDISDVDTTFRLDWAWWTVWDADVDPTAPDTGNQIFAYDCLAATGSAPAGCDFIPLTSSGIQPGSGGTTVFTTGGLGSGDVIESSWPLWAMSYAEEKFAALGQAPLADTRVYIGVDPDEALPGTTQADYSFGNQPSVCLQGDAYHSKFRAAHEYGHTQTLTAVVDFDPVDLDYDYDGEGLHLFDSQEWQSAASIEGMAHFYAISTWHDVDAAESCVNCLNATRYVDPGGPSDAESPQIRRPNGPVCVDAGMLVCADGVSVEWDWASALKEFRQSSSAPDYVTIFGMLAAYYDSGNWHASGQDDDFWQDMDAEMSTYLGSAQSDWDAAAAAWELDR